MLLNLMFRLPVPTGECSRQTASLQRTWSYCHEIVGWRASPSVPCCWLTYLHGE